MADSVTFEVKGLRELGERMRGLSAKMQNSIAASATGAAASIVKKAAISNVVSSPSVDTGSLRDAIIAKKIPKSQSQYTSEHIVTVRGRGKPKVNKKGVKQAQAPHAGLVEFGTVNMPAEPFLRPAIDNNIDKATNAMRDKIASRLTKAGA